MSDDNDLDNESRDENNSENQLNVFKKNIMNNLANILSLKFINKLI